MNVDLHFHYRRRFEDVDDRLVKMVKTAEKAGVNGIVLLDHQYFPTNDVLASARKAAPTITFWRGCELTIVDEARQIEDDVVIASDQPIDFDCSHKLSTKNLKAFSEACRRDDVFTMLAHPFRKHNSVAFDFSEFRPIMIDAMGRTANQNSLQKVVNLAACWGMALASNSDAHVCRHIGRHYLDFKDKLDSVKDLIEAVYRSRYRVVTG